MSPRRLALLAVCVLTLTACRLDASVNVEMEPDGTGEVTVLLEADAELMAQVPGIVDDLRLEDAEAAGWEVGEPVSTDDGGTNLTLTHAFRSAEELANVLNSIGPPMLDMAAARTADDETDQTTNAITGQLQLRNGFESFADADLISAVGGLPFEEELTASGATPAESMSFELRAALPGQLVSAETGTEVGDDVIEWQAPLDGSAVDVFVQTVQRPADAGASWAGPLASVSLVLLVGWVIVAGAFIAFVAVARRNKRRRRERALRRLDRHARTRPG